MTIRYSAFAVSALALATVVTAFMGFGSAMSDPDALIRRHIETALGGAEVYYDDSGHSVRSREHVRLTANPSSAAPPAFPGAVALGDRITLSGQDGTQRTLEVIDIRDVAPLVADTASEPSRTVLLVTCAGVSDDDRDLRLRFLVERAPPQPGIAPHAATQRAL